MRAFVQDRYGTAEALRLALEATMGAHDNGNHGDTETRRTHGGE